MQGEVKQAKKGVAQLVFQVLRIVIYTSSAVVSWCMITPSLYVISRRSLIICASLHTKFMT